MKTLVVYRDNDLFKRYTSEMLTNMDEINVIETFVVPRGVQVESLKEKTTAVIDRARTLGAECVITDRTCRGVVGPDYSKWTKVLSLESPFQEQVEKVNPDRTQAELFVWFAKTVASDSVIKSIVVVKDSIGDHSFVGKRDDADRVPTNRVPGYEDKLVSWVEKQLQNAFPEATTTIVDKLEDALALADNPETMLVLDRHCGVKEVMDSKKDGWYHNMANWPHQAILFMLPLETCLELLISRGDFEFEFDIAEMQEDIRQQLKPRSRW